MRRVGPLPLILIVAGCMTSTPVRTKAIAVGAAPTKSSGPTLSSVDNKSPSPTPANAASPSATAAPQPSATAKPTTKPSGTPTVAPTAQPTSNTPAPSSSVGGVVYNSDPLPSPTPTPVPVPPSAVGVSTYAGRGNQGFIDALAADSEFTQPYALAVQGSAAMFVGDRSGNRVRRIDLATRQVSTVAGSGVAGYHDGIGQQAQFKTMNALTLDAAGNVYVADAGNSVIRKIDMSDPGNPSVSTLAGIAGTPGKRDGAAGQALFSGPWCMTVVGRTLYVADAGNRCVRAIDLDSLNVSTFAGTGTAGTADGPAANATFTSPQGLAVDAASNFYISDAGTHVIRRIDWADGNHAVTTVAGRGSAGNVNADGTNAAFNTPRGVAVGSDGNLYVADTNNHVIRKIDLASAGRTVTTYAGTGTAGFFDGDVASAKFDTPVGLLWAAGGLCVADTNNFRVRLIQ
ncbi:MAG: hypothetical protein JWM80_2637 [Cyanobacteria bacterium RYN_339]|nr:hypothetical protein [Cyanobacteria bacterium RYN_339]